MFIAIQPLDMDKLSFLLTWKIIKLKKWSNHFLKFNNHFKGVKTGSLVLKWTKSKVS